MTQQGAASRREEDFAEWVRPHLVAMYRLAVAMTSQDEAADAVQDALARAWLKRNQFDPSRGTAANWLLAIVADRARRYWRRAPRVTLSQLIPHDDTTMSIISMDLRKAVDKLPDRQRSAIILFHYIDLSVEDVASLMHCSTGTVKSTLHDARAKLRLQLGASYARD